MTGKTCAGLWVKGIGKDGKPREVYIYHIVDNEVSLPSLSCSKIVLILILILTLLSSQTATLTSISSYSRPQTCNHFCLLCSPDWFVQWTMREYGAQAVVWQTAINPVIALELLATGVWSGKVCLLLPLHTLEKHLHLDLSLNTVFSLSMAPSSCHLTNSAFPRVC